MESLTPTRICALGVALVLAGCASVPSGPDVLVLPGSSTSFEQFQQDDSVCRGFATASIGTSAKQASQEAGVGSAVVGTAVGAAAGAAIGAAAGAPATGAAIGAGSGLLFGSAAGVGRADASGATLQRRYDNAYLQCMYAKGNQVPMARSMLPQPAPTPYAAPRAHRPPPPTSRDLPPPPPPPAGPPPPPPPDA
ncbi:MAG TPA: glycine zipper family protein [Myxococcota bacterium]|nr:glycine zipper family protein [Myxococcota bacterium]